MSSLVIVYSLLGPCVWIVFLIGLFKGRQRLSLLRRPLWELPDPPPRATVLVPIKDEAKQLRTCFASVLALDYPNLQIIAIDDRSIDGSGEILDQLAREDSRLQVVHIHPGELPSGWVGKPHALHVGMRHATGDWLLFVDSDMQLAPDALRATIALAEVRRFDLISLLPRLVNESFFERLIVPLGAMATSAMFLLPMSNYNEVPFVAFANGQFMLVRRCAYEAIGGHESVRDQLSEDLGIARALKRLRFRPRLAIGSDFVSTRMYDSRGAIMSGWSRNFFGGTDGRPGKLIGAILFVPLCCLSAFVAMSFGGVWTALGVAHWILMTIAVALSYLWTCNRARYALLFPVGAIVMIAIWCRSLWMCATRRVEWRGTQYGGDRKETEPHRDDSAVAVH